MERKLNLCDLPKVKKVGNNYIMENVKSIQNNSNELMTITDTKSITDLTNVLLVNVYTGKWTIKDYKNWSSRLLKISQNYLNSDTYLNKITTIIKNENDSDNLNSIKKALPVKKFAIKSTNNYEILTILKQFIGELTAKSLASVRLISQDKANYSIDKLEKAYKICTSEEFKNSEIYINTINNVNTIFEDDAYNNKYFKNIYNHFIENDLIITIKNFLNSRINELELVEKSRLEGSLGENHYVEMERTLKRRNPKVRRSYGQF